MRQLPVDTAASNNSQSGLSSVSGVFPFQATVVEVYRYLVIQEPSPKKLSKSQWSWLQSSPHGTNALYTLKILLMMEFNTHIL